MSDSAFATCMFPGLTTKELEDKYAAAYINGHGDIDFCTKAQKELDRRYAVRDGDMTQMTAGERLRFVKNGYKW